MLRAELLFYDSFRMKWKTSAAMRKAFFSDVGISALNLWFGFATMFIWLGFATMILDLPISW